MGLFVCEQCGHVENTALSNYWLRGQHGHDVRALCSDCDPDLKGHTRFERASWDGQLVRNPDVIARFISFRCATDKCSHLSLGDAGRYHLGAIGVCKDCGILAEIIDVGQKRRELEHDSRYKPEDYKWKVLA
jgi:hypothetical protein